MLASTDCAPLKVLTPSLAERLRIFNAAARTLQLMGVRLLHLAPLENKLTIEPEAGRKLLSAGRVGGYQRFGTAGSNRYVAQFQGVSLEWREPISYARPDSWALPQLNQGTLQ